MKSEEVDHILERWHGLPGEARETVVRLEQVAREAIRELEERGIELAAERKRVDRWRSAFDDAQAELQRAGDRHADANRELAAKREQLHKMAEALRAAVPMHHSRCALSPRGGECDCWMRMREAALTEYDASE